MPLFYYLRPEEAIEKSGLSSCTTHGTQSCIEACRYLGALLVGALNGVSKDELLSNRYTPVSMLWDKFPLIKEIDSIAAGSFKINEPPVIKSTGYVVDTLEAVLWAFYHSESFREGCLRVVNLGGDADTAGAVYGQLAGAYYGRHGIPESWINKLAKKDLIEDLAVKLFKMSRL